MTFLDARAPDGDGIVDADLCIIGSGAAGITLARAFIGQPWRVAVIAGGGLEFRHRPQLLYRGANVGRENFSTSGSRLRMFGGSTTRWTGQCRPLDAIDFEARPQLSQCGWPFDRNHLEPFYRRAAEVCCLDASGFASDPTAAPTLHRLAGNDDALAPVLFRFGHPTDFGAVYRDELAAAGNIWVYLDTHAVEIELDPEASRVVAVRAATFAGRRLRFTGQAVVLACGGIENPRLLLASNRVARTGVGNAYDQVGRYFMDHPYFWAGYLDPADPADRNGFSAVDYGRAGAALRSHAALALSEPARRAEGLNGAVTFLVWRPRHKASPVYLSRGGTALTRVFDILTHKELPDRRLLRHLGEAARGIRDGIGLLDHRLRPLARVEQVLALRVTIEVTPDPDSRVTLGTGRDHFGMPRLQVDWRLRGDDQRGAERLLSALSRAMAVQGAGRLVEARETDAEGWPVAMTGGKHHMGTTRMHTDPRRGVVDAHCRVHDVANLYVAGSSLFPTSGYANPTLTIVALALRLADHLKERLASDV